MNTGLRKLWGDIAATPGRFAMMIIAIAISSAAIIAMLLAYSVLTREVNENYLAINPAAAQLMTGDADVFKTAEDIFSIANKNQSIKDVEVGAQSYFQVEVSPNQFVTALLFVVPDFDHLKINKIKLDKGSWPNTGSIILERKALKVARLKIGDEIKLKSHTGQIHALSISGSAHDPALAPADTEHMIYGYISQQTMVALNETPDEHFIKLTLPTKAMDKAAIELVASDLTKKLQPFMPIHEIRIPPPATHPHQNQMTSGLKMILAFSVLAVLLGSLLIATTVWGLLAQQVRQIGIMKTLGASSFQIASLYLMLVTGIACIALAIGLPSGIIAGKNIIAMAADILNLNINSLSMPINLWLMTCLFCVGLPALLAYLPIRKAANKSVTAALNDYGVVETFGRRQSNYLNLKIFSPVLILLLTNLNRRRARTFFIVALLAIAGALFLASQNLLTSWDTLEKKAEAHRRYQLEISFSNPINQQELNSTLNSLDFIQHLEIWNKYSVTPTRADGLNIMQTYPDGGHGSLTLHIAPVNTKLISLEFAQGHWFNEVEKNELILNQSAHQALFKETQIGDSIKLHFQDRDVTFKLVGVLKEPLSGASAYANLEDFPALGINSLRIALRDKDSLSIDRSAVKIEQTFKTKNIGLSAVITENHRQKSGKGHLVIMVVILVMIAIVMAVVGFIGLTTVISTNVSERLREFAVMRTLGAKSRVIFSLVVNESILIALASYLIALPIAVSFSAAIVRTVAAISLQPVSVNFSTTGLLIWLVALLVGAVFASLIPAINATRFTIREVLAYQ